MTQIEGGVKPDLEANRKPVVSNGAAVLTRRLTQSNPGTYSYYAWVNEIGDTEGIGKGEEFYVVFNEKPLDSLTISVKAHQSSATVGDMISATATASGGDEQYSYAFKLTRDGNTVFQSDYGYEYRSVEQKADTAGTWVYTFWVMDESGNVASAQSSPITVVDAVHEHIAGTPQLKENFIQKDAENHTVYRRYEIYCTECGDRMNTNEEILTEPHTFNASGICTGCKYKKTDDLSLSVKADKTTVEVSKTIGATATPVGGDGSYSYSWVVMRDGVETYSTTTGFPEHFELVADVIGQYVLVATVADGSGKTATAQSEAINVAEKQPAIITSFTMKPTSVFVGEEVEFTVNTNADEIQMVIDGNQTYDSDIKQVSADGTISFTRTFSQAGKRVISFHARYQGDANWGAVYDQPKTLKVNEFIVPAFALTGIKCESSNEAYGSLGDTVTVTWDPPKWPYDNELKPDVYVLWITGPGVEYNETLKANRQSVTAPSDATSMEFTDSEYTMQPGNYSIEVYAMLQRDGREAQSQATGNGEFTITKSAVTITEPNTLTPGKPFAVSGKAEGPIGTVSIKLLDKNGTPLTLQTDAGNATALTATVRNKPYAVSGVTCEGIDSGEEYTLEVTGYFAAKPDTVAAQSSKKIEAKDGEFRVSVHAVSSNKAKAGGKIGNLVDGGALTTEEETVAIYAIPLKGETLYGAMVWVDGKAFNAAKQSDGSYKATVTLETGKTHTILVNNSDGSNAIRGKITVTQVRSGWHFEKSSQYNGAGLHIWNDQANALAAMGKEYYLAYSNGDPVINGYGMLLGKYNSYDYIYPVGQYIIGRQTVALSIVDKETSKIVANFEYAFDRFGGYIDADDVKITLEAPHYVSLGERFTIKAIIEGPQTFQNAEVMWGTLDHTVVDFVNNEGKNGYLNMAGEWVSDEDAPFRKSMIQRANIKDGKFIFECPFIAVNYGAAEIHFSLNFVKTVGTYIHVGTFDVERYYSMLKNTKYTSNPLMDDDVYYAALRYLKEQGLSDEAGRKVLDTVKRVSAADHVYRDLFLWSLCDYSIKAPDHDSTNTEAFFNPNFECIEISEKYISQAASIDLEALFHEIGHAIDYFPYKYKGAAFTRSPKYRERLNDALMRDVKNIIKYEVARAAGYQVSGTNPLQTNDTKEVLFNRLINWKDGENVTQEDVTAMIDAIANNDYWDYHGIGMKKVVLELSTLMQLFNNHAVERFDIPVPLHLSSFPKTWERALDLLSARLRLWEMQKQYQNKNYANGAQMFFDVIDGCTAGRTNTVGGHGAGYWFNPDNTPNYMVNLEA